MGEAIVSGEFPEKRREASLTVTQVMKAAKWTRKAAMSRSGSSGDIVLDKAVWEKIQRRNRKDLVKRALQREAIGGVRRSSFCYQQKVWDNAKGGRKGDRRPL